MPVNMTRRGFLKSLAASATVAASGVATLEAIAAPLPRKKMWFVPGNYGEGWYLKEDSDEILWRGIMERWDEAMTNQFHEQVALMEARRIQEPNTVYRQFSPQGPEDGVDWSTMGDDRVAVHTMYTKAHPEGVRLPVDDYVLDDVLIKGVRPFPIEVPNDSERFLPRNILDIGKPRRRGDVYVVGIGETEE